ncbi:MAG TPA: hypothetical protein VHM69_20015 [Rubrobacter sp.]|nr:hypothetical protein [Rubrobacter sp.]
MGSRGSVFEGKTLFVAVVGVVAALLVWGLTAAPAFAQATAGDVNIQYVDCSQVQAAVAEQYNSGDAIAADNATAGNNGSAANAEATAEIAQELGISQEQVNACLNGADGAPTDNGADDGADTTTAGKVNSSTDVIPQTKSASELPNTGGAPLPGAVAGFALVAAGILSVGLIVRRGR